MEIPRIPLAVGKSEDRSYDQYVADAPTSQDEATRAAYDLAVPDTLLNLVSRKMGINELENRGATPLTPEQANERYPQMATPFREAVNPYVAQMLADKQEETNTLQRKITQGPQDGWTKTKMFGAGLVAHALDVGELGAGALIGWGVGGLAARGALGARAAVAVGDVAAGTASTGTRLAVNAGEAIIGGGVQNAVQEGLQANVEGAEGFDSGRTTMDVVKDWAVGTFMGGALQLGIKEGAWHMKGMSRMLRSTSPEADLSVARGIVQAVESDIRPNPDAVLKSLAQETSVLPQDHGHAPYNFEPVSPETVNTKKFYAATIDNHPDLSMGEKAHLGDDYGFGTHVSDNPGVANAAASRAMADSPGMVHEVGIVGEVRPLPLSAPILADEGLARSLADVIGVDHGGKLEGVFQEGDTVKDVLGTIRNLTDEGYLPRNTLEQVHQLIMEHGYNAMLDDGASRLGQEHAQHNHLTILDDNMIENKGPRQPDPSMVKVPTSEELTAATNHNVDPNSKFFVDMEQHTQALSAIEEFHAQSKVDLAALSKAIDESIQAVETLRDQGFFSEAEAKKIRDEYVEKRQVAEDKHKLLKAFKDCVGA